jgi:hypothetical protein
MHQLRTAGPHALATEAGPLVAADHQNEQFLARCRLRMREHVRRSPCCECACCGFTVQRQARYSPGALFLFHKGDVQTRIHKLPLYRGSHAHTSARTHTRSHTRSHAQTSTITSAYACQRRVPEQRATVIVEAPRAPLRLPLSQSSLDSPLQQNHQPDQTRAPCSFAATTHPCRQDSTAQPRFVAAKPRTPK